MKQTKRRLQEFERMLYKTWANTHTERAKAELYDMNKANVLRCKAEAFGEIRKRFIEAFPEGDYACDLKEQ